MSGNFQMEYLDKIAIDEFDIIINLYGEILKEMKRKSDATR